MSLSLTRGRRGTLTSGTSPPPRPIPNENDMKAVVCGAASAGGQSRKWPRSKVGDPGFAAATVTDFSFMRVFPAPKLRQARP